MNYEEYNKQRMMSAISSSPTVKGELTKAIREKRTQLSNLKLQTAYEKTKKVAKAVHKQVGKAYTGMTEGLYKMGKQRMKNKQVLKGKQKVTIVENQPVYSRDKSRFFKAAWEEEKRQLFFK